MIVLMNNEYFRAWKSMSTVSGSINYKLKKSLLEDSSQDNRSVVEIIQNKFDSDAAVND